MNRGEVEELVQTTVRKINSGPEACLTNPRVLSFFNMMKDSVTRCLQSVTSAATTPQEMVASYNTVLQWPSSRHDEEVDSVLRRYPSVKDAYTYSAVYIVEQTYKKDNQKLKLKLPSFQQFLKTFYTQVLQSEPLQKGTYETLQYFEKEMLLCQAFCNALYSSIRTEPIRGDPSVIVESLAAGAAAGAAGAAGRSAASKDPQATKTRSTAPTPSRASKNAPVDSQIALASRFSSRALSPLDSVSQAVRPGTSGSARPGALTEDAINRHRNQSGTTKNREAPKIHPAAASATAITQATANTQKKDSVRVINVLEHPQRHMAAAAAAGAHSEESSYSTSSSDSDKVRRSEKKHQDYEEDSYFAERSSRDRDRDRDRDDRYNYDRDRDYDREHERGRGDPYSSHRQNPNRRH